MKELQSTLARQRLECSAVPWSAIWHSTLASTLHSSRWSATPIQQSKMAWIFGVTHSVECQSKYPELNVLSTNQNHIFVRCFHLPVSPSANMSVQNKFRGKRQKLRRSKRKNKTSSEGDEKEENPRKQKSKKKRRRISKVIEVLRFHLYLF